MIEVNGISKNYEVVKKNPGLRGAIKGLFSREVTEKKAVKDISFNIADGELVGFIGTNGAGKSTTIKMLCGILTPTDGQIELNGFVPHENRQKIAKDLGVVFGQRSQLFWDIAVRESYDLLKHIYEVPEEDYQKNLALFTEVLDLEPLLDIPVRQLSLGQKMRCELGAAFLHNPSIVFLDEPTIGLDVMVKDKIRNFVKEMNRLHGTTVLLTTHDMQDIEEICDRVIIIDEGEILFDDSLVKVKDIFGAFKFIKLELEEGTSFDLPASLESLLVSKESEGNLITLTLHKGELSIATIIASLANINSILDVSVSDPTIEDIVKQICAK